MQLKGIYTKKRGHEDGFWKLWSFSIKKCFLLFGLWLIGYQLKAQTKFSDNLFISAHLHHGYNLPMYKFIGANTNDYINSLSVNIYKESSGENYWNQLYNYPAKGIAVFYSTLGNDEVFGREIAIYPFFRIPLFQKKNFVLFNQMGLGLSYANKKFNLTDNYLNTAISSGVNIHFNLRFGFRYLIGKHMGLEMGTSFDHLSNGNTYKPNLGLNYVTFWSGISVCMGNQTEKKTLPIPENERTVSFDVFSSIGGKYTRALLDKYYITSSLSLELNKSINRKFLIGIGSDLFYDTSVKDVMDYNKMEYKPEYRFQTGIHISQMFEYNKMKFGLQEGVFLIFKEKIENYRYYTRAVIQYHIYKSISLRFCLKSNLHVLDYPELGIGYRFL